LRAGLPAALGPVDEVVDAYLEYTRARDDSEAEDRAAVRGAEGAVLRVDRVVLEDADGREVDTLTTGEPLTVRVWVERAARADVVPAVGVALVRNDGLVCYCVSTEMDDVLMDRLPDGRFTIGLHLPALPLLGGGYYVNVATTDKREGLIAYDARERLCPFRVRNPSHEYGVMRIPHRWVAEGAKGATPQPNRHVG
jgi:hypothetical protein